MKTTTQHKEGDMSYQDLKDLGYELYAAGTKYSEMGVVHHTIAIKNGEVYNVHPGCKLEGPLSFEGGQIFTAYAGYDDGCYEKLFIERLSDISEVRKLRKI